MALPSSRNYLQAKGNHSSLAKTALANAKALSAAGTSVGSGLCLANVRKAYGIGAEYPSAITAFDAVPSEYTHTWYNPPAGVPVFWSGGSAGDGHIAIADGNGNVWSTDIKREGKWDLVPIAEIHSNWGLKYEGWTEILNGVRVYSL